jgi:hypothetical protein
MSWRRVVTRSALLTMETLWTYALVAFLIAVLAHARGPSFWAVAAVVGVSFSVSRLLQASDFGVGVIRVWGMLLSFLIFYAIARVDFYGDWRFWDFSFADQVFNNTEETLRDDAKAVVGIPLLWFFWLRGISRGQEHLGFEAVLQSFVIGIIVVAVVEVFAEGAGAPDLVRYIPVPYVAVGLVAISLAHAARSEDQFGRSFGPTWLIAIGSAILPIGVFALLFLFFDLGDVFRAGGSAVAAISDLLLDLLALIIWPFVKLIELMFIGMRELISLFSNPDQSQAERELQQNQPEQEEQAEGDTRPEWLRLLMRVLTAGGIIGFVVWATWFAFKRFQKRGQEEAVRESTYQEGRLASDLGDFLGSLFGRLRPRFGGSENMDATRRLYFDLLAAGAARGVERRPPETPLELSPRLDRAFASDTPEQITLLFDDARYGGLSPPDAEVERLREELEALKQR